MLLLREDQFASDDTAGGQKDDCRDAAIFGGREQRDGPAFAVTDGDDSLRIDIPSTGNHLHDSSQVFRELSEPRGFDATAALADSPLVVPHDEKPGIGQCSSKLA